MKKIMLIWIATAAATLCATCSNAVLAAPTSQRFSTILLQANHFSNPANSITYQTSKTNEKQQVQQISKKSKKLTKYVNERFGFSIQYPTSWKAGEEAFNGDGKSLYTNNPNVDIRVYGSNYLQGISDPYHKQEKGMKRKKVILNNGKEAILVTGKQNNRIMYDMVYMSKDGATYHFYADVPQTFFDANQKLLLQVAKSLDFSNE
ncbi:hypothetical protein ACE3MZ_21020 [Paenibacillus sp. WLX1005]|uniref:hypothetical protein n=1 Tax=Paenibacillus sp. WLX1005 TaxID=3243766 RepID=UPI003983E002